MADRRRSTLFDRWSGAYDNAGLQRSTYRPIHDAVISRLEPIQPSSILDLGCGTGQLTARLCERFPNTSVVGVDYSPGMLKEAAIRLRSSMGRLLLADAQHLPFAETSFDIVTCTESFHWYPDQRKALADVARVLRPEGRLLIVSIATLTGVGDDLLRRASALVGQEIRAVPPGRLAELLVEAGFDVREQHRVPRGLVPWPVLTDARRADSLH